MRQLKAGETKSASPQPKYSRSLKLEWKMRTLSSFDNLAAFDTAGANFDALARAIDQRADSLQVRIKAAAGPVIRVGNIVAELRAFAAKFTTISHNYLQSSLGYLLND
jgi:hypothetical protein